MIASPWSTEEPRVDTSDEDSDGNAKPQKGSGTTGYGRPLDTVNAGKWKPFTDGNGLCSPGRWAPQNRMIEKSGTARNLRHGLLRIMHEHIDIKDTYFKLATGKCSSTPFSDVAERSGRALLLETLTSMGAEGNIIQVADGQPYMLHAMGEAARLMGDPDWRILTNNSHSFANGVRNGFRSKLRRTPAVFERKTRW